MISLDNLLIVGSHFYDKKDYETSLQIYLEANKIQPDNPIILSNIGSAYNGLNNFEEALRYLNIANEMQPKHPTVLNNIGTAYNGLNNPEEALKYLTKAHEIQPNNPFVYKNMASSYRLMDDKNKATDNLKLSLTYLERRGKGIAKKHKPLFLKISKEFKNLGLNVKDYM